MQRIKALFVALALCFAASPAFAGFSVVAGTGPGGGPAATFNGSNQVIALQPTSSLAAGNVAVMVMNNIVSGGTSGGWSCVDTKSNTWTSIGVEAVAGSATQIMWSILGTGLTTSDTVTCTQASGPLGTTGTLIDYSATSAISLDVSASNSGGASNVSTLTVGPTATGTCNGGANCRLAICAMALLDPATNTLDASYTSIGVSSPGDLAIGHKFISSSTAAQSCTNTFSPATRATGQVVVFKEAAAGTTAGKIMFQSVP